MGRDVQPDSYGHYAAVTLSDVTNFPDGECDAIHIGVSGDVVAIRPDGTAVTILAPLRGMLPIRAIRINATGTTADSITALYWRKP